MVELQVENLSVGYDGVAVCENICFTVNAGDYLCVIGENGAGKSTLIKTLLGFVPPVAGKIERAADVGGIGYLAQRDTSRRNFPASVWEIVLSGCLARSGLRPFYNRAERALALKKMEILGIRAIRRKSFGELSGGQQQKVLLARMLCAAEKIMLLDEPVTGLDPSATQDLYETIQKLNKECGTTVLMVTHDMNALRYANAVLQIGHGGSEFSSAEEYFARKRRVEASHE